MYMYKMYMKTCIAHVILHTHLYMYNACLCSDMFGAVTQPLKVTRTIVTGQSYTLVCRLLYLLTYFIR